MLNSLGSHLISQHLTAFSCNSQVTTSQVKVRLTVPNIRWFMSQEFGGDSFVKLNETGRHIYIYRSRCRK